MSAHVRLVVFLKSKNKKNEHKAYASPSFP